MNIQVGGSNSCRKTSHLGVRRREGREEGCVEVSDSVPGIELALNGCESLGT